jgi:hypothetical protein
MRHPPLSILKTVKAVSFMADPKAFQAQAAAVAIRDTVQGCLE